MRKWLIVLIFVKGLCCAWAQEKCPVKFGKVSAEDFNVTSPLITSNSNAVIIADVGEVTFSGNSRAWLSFSFTRHTRIKLLNKKAFHLATISVYLYHNETGAEKLDNIRASAWNLENGRVTETALDPADIKDEKVNKGLVKKKAAIPGVKEGTILEYSYTIKSDFNSRFPEWIFQSEDGPTLWSELNAEIPGLLYYQFFSQSYYPFAVNSRKDGYQRYRYNTEEKDAAINVLRDEKNLSVSMETSVHRWLKKDVPEFVQEQYIYSSMNFLDKISAQLTGFSDGRIYHDMLGNWKSLYQELMADEDFGLRLDDKSLSISNVLNDLISRSDTSKLEIAKKIFNYIQENITCVNRDYIWLTSTFDEVLRKKTGTVGDINLLLVAMLRAADINASPVILSTQEHGRAWRNIPLLNQMNYVVCKSSINSLDYFLDAAKPLQPFGELPMDCYNGYARVLSVDTAEVNLNPDLLKNETQYSAFVTNGDKNIVAGRREYIPGHFESLEIKQTGAGSSFRSKVQKSFSEYIHLDSTSISYNNTGSQIQATSWFTIPDFGKNDMVYFNPMMGSELQKNPFNAKERLYPVEMPFASDYLYTLNMEVPDGYEIESLPASSRVALNEKDGMFEYLLSQQDGVIYFKCHISLKKALFSSDDYQTLRDFYDFILKKESEQIVFKKKK